MRILVVHNRYREYGGEDSVFGSEVALLRSAGHQVDTLTVSNDSIGDASARFSAALLCAYNPSARKRIETALAANRPDVVHVHNFFPLISPSVFYACAAVGIPAVWTLHNYRIACANGLLFRDGAPCEKCLGATALWGVAHRCYRGSVAGSAAVAAMIEFNRRVGTWRRKVARFIALTQFSRRKLEAAGVPSERICVKPNFVPDPGVHGRDTRAGVVFVGRLSREKGVHSLMRAWRDLDIPLTVIGDGPEMADLRAMAPPGVRFAGHCSREQTLAAMGQAAAMIVPSIWYECFPVATVEAMSLGTPILASRIGALEEIIEDGVSGHHFNPGDAADMARVARAAFTDPTRLRSMGAAARTKYETEYSPKRNLEMLVSIYDEVTRGSRARQHASSA